jgi:lysyl endopeptidase
MTTRSTLRTGLWLIGCFAVATAGLAQSLGPLQMPPASAVRSAPAARLPLLDALAAKPLAELPPAAAAAAERLAALAAWNAAGKLPVKVGFARALPAPAAVRLDGIAAGTAAAPARPFAGGLLAGAASGSGELAWGTHVRVANAYRLRLHLTGVHLPAGTVMWVAAKGGAPHAFGLDLRSPAGDLWTPSVFGESLLFEIHVPAGSAEARFTAREVMEIFRPARLAPPGRSGRRQPEAPGAPTGSSQDISCLVDSSCIGDSVLPQIAVYRHAMAQLLFVEDGGEFLCSGSLLNDSAGDFAPYLLTANHCFADQEAASSLEAVFDFFTSSCNGAAPDETTLPTANGGTLLATGATSDFTFVRLSSVPPGRSFLGWNADAGAVPNGTALYRLSFPAPGGVADPEQFSQSAVNTGDSIPVCDQGLDARPRPDYIYASVTTGGTVGGSSGSPALLAGGQVVGQLTGACAFSGHDPSDGCDRANSEFDGAFSVTFPWIAAYLSPSNTCYALSLSHTGPGSDPVASPAGSSVCLTGMYTAGTAIQLTAAPAAGAVVLDWSGPVVDGSADSTQTLNMPAMDISIGVTYATCYPLSVSHTGSGSDPAASPASAPGCSAGNYFSGEEVTLYASPAPGWFVFGWGGTSDDASSFATNLVFMPAASHAASVTYLQSGFYTLPPCRLIDTRAATGGIGGPALQPSSSREFSLGGVCGIPASAKALSVNVTITQPASSGFLTASAGSGTSIIDFSAGQTLANNAVLPMLLDINRQGFLVVQNGSSGTVQLIVDVNGYFQ